MKPNCSNTGNIVIGLRRLFEKTDLTQNGGRETTYFSIILKSEYLIDSIILKSNSENVKITICG